MRNLGIREKNLDVRYDDVNDDGDDDAKYEEYTEEDIEAMYEDRDNDILLTTTKTFDDTLTMKERMALVEAEERQQQQQVRFQLGHEVKSGCAQTKGPQEILTYLSDGTNRIVRSQYRQTNTIMLF